MNKKDITRDYLKDILIASQQAGIFTDGLTLTTFEDDIKTQYAVIRAIEIIGEASRKIPLEIKDKYQEIPWKEMVGMRDKMIHDYMGVVIAVVWKTVRDDLPGLSTMIQKVLEEIGE